jgi:5-methylcytosine-specific restriction enzyme A
MRVGRLKLLGAQLGTLKPRLAASEATGRAEVSRKRDREQAIRAQYKTAKWQRLRWQVLVDGLFTCVMCKRVEADTSQLVADHVVAHRGDEGLFWDRGNLQCLCKGCHDGAKQREERRGW